MAFFEQENMPSTMHYERKVIKDVQMEDEAIYLIGKAENKNPSEEFDLNDGTGLIRVRNIPDATDSIEVGKIYRVVGRISIDGAGERFLAVDLIQKVENLDLKLYQQALELKKQIS